MTTKIRKKVKVYGNASRVLYVCLAILIIIVAAATVPYLVRPIIIQTRMTQTQELVELAQNLKCEPSTTTPATWQKDVESTYKDGEIVTKTLEVKGERFNKYPKLGFFSEGSYAKPLPALNCLLEMANKKDPMHTINLVLGYSLPRESSDTVGFTGYLFDQNRSDVLINIDDLKLEAQEEQRSEEAYTDGVVFHEFFAHATLEIHTETAPYALGFAYVCAVEGVDYANLDKCLALKKEGKILSELADELYPYSFYIPKVSSEAYGIMREIAKHGHFVTFDLNYKP